MHAADAVYHHPIYITIQYISPSNIYHHPSSSGPTNKFHQHFNQVKESLKKEEKRGMPQNEEGNKAFLEVARILEDSDDEQCTMYNLAQCNTLNELSVDIKIDFLDNQTSNLFLDISVMLKPSTGNIEK